MIATVMRSFILVQILGVEVLVNARLGGHAPDLTAVFLVYAALTLNARSSLLLMLLLAIPRSLLMPGALHAQLWLLLGLWLLLRTLSSYLFSERWYWQMLLCALAAVGLSLGQAMLFGQGLGDPMRRSVLAVFLSGVIGPGLLLILPLLGQGMGLRHARAKRTEPSG
ncbi:MAG: hypothetical protein CSA62_08875 [Planctomycetota bacterium]|nr:MAG: hypothetical protein CSA62_08875 [Planctomycetota bacterium]